MTSIVPAKPQVDPVRVLEVARSFGFIGSGADSVARLMSLFCDPRATADELAALIQNHPILCARVLRVANSAYYGQNRTISTVKRAILVLGVDAVRGVAAAVCIDRATLRRAHIPLLDMGALLRHSLATAVAAESLARRKCESLASEAFIAGILHNLGVAVQASIDTTGVNAMIDARQRDPVTSIREFETEHSAVAHEDCTAVILDAWQLPPSLVAAAGYHHRPTEAPPAHRGLASLVNLAATSALACGHTYTLEPARVEYDIQATNQLGFAAEELGQVTADLPQRVKDLQRAILGT